MVVSRFDPQAFFQRIENVALRVPASEIFGLLSRRLNLPAQWAALVGRDGGDHTLVRAGGNVDGTDAESILFIRTTPVELTVNEDGILSRDKYSCRAEVSLKLSIIPERGELLSFEKQVLGSHRVTQIAGLARFLEPAVRTALVRSAAAQDAEALVTGRANEELAAQVTDAVEAVCFTAGLALAASPTVSFASDSFRQIQETREAASRRKAEHEAAYQVKQALRTAQNEHLEHLSTLLTKVKELAADSPDVALPELLRTFSEKQRGELYQALFATEPASEQTQWIVAACGDELVYYNPRQPAQPARRLQIAGSAGPIRSIQAFAGADGQTSLWLGAATGVYRLPVASAEPDLTLLVDPAPSVRGGFNAVVVAGNRIFASHSEIGLCEWNIDEPSNARRRFESMTKQAKTVRDVEFHEGRVYVAIDDRILYFAADDPEDQPLAVLAGSTATITAICPTPDGVYAGNADGDVLFWPADQNTRPQRIHTGLGRAVESLWLLESHGVRRIVYTDTSLAVHARVLGDSFACRYDAGGQTLRRVEVAADLLAATNDLRDRLILWSPGEPVSPKNVLHVSRITGHSIQDACLVPAAALA
jgi:hypothetical protein